MGHFSGGKMVDHSCAKLHVAVASAGFLDVLLSRKPIFQILSALHTNITYKYNQTIHINQVGSVLECWVLE